MPPKACQGEFIHMMAMPKIRRVSISVLFLFSTWSFFPYDSEIGHFKEKTLKVGHFEEKARDPFKTEK